MFPVKPEAVPDISLVIKTGSVKAHPRKLKAQYYFTTVSSMHFAFDIDVERNPLDMIPIKPISVHMTYGIDWEKNPCAAPAYAPRTRDSIYENQIKPMFEPEWLREAGRVFGKAIDESMRRTLLEKFFPVKGHTE